jgi:hypothetical protein
MNVTTEDFPVIGTLIMIVVFVYAWIADTSERKEAFTVNLARLPALRPSTEALHQFFLDIKHIPNS